MKKQAQQTVVGPFVRRPLAHIMIPAGNREVMDSLGIAIAGFPLPVQRSARKLFELGKTKDEIVKACGNLALQIRQKEEKEERERRETLRKANEKSALQASAALELEKAMEVYWNKVTVLNQEIEAEEDAFTRRILIEMLPEEPGTVAPVKKERKVTVTSTTTDKTESLISRIRALLPASESAIIAALSDIKSSYVKHYLREYSQGKPSKGKSGVTLTNGLYVAKV